MLLSNICLIQTPNSAAASLPACPSLSLHPGIAATALVPLERDMLALRALDRGSCLL